MIYALRRARTHESSSSFFYAQCAFVVISKFCFDLLFRHDLLDLFCMFLPKDRYLERLIGGVYGAEA